VAAVVALHNRQVPQAVVALVEVAGKIQTLVLLVHQVKVTQVAVLAQITKV
jgi:hypothetical protein